MPDVSLCNFKSKLYRLKGRYSVYSIFLYNDNPSVNVSLWDMELGQ